MRSDLPENYEWVKFKETMSKNSSGVVVWFIFFIFINW